MKCPKCGSNSFEHLSFCKKCNADLNTFKQNHGISPVVLPAFLQQTAPEAPAKEETADDLLAWDLPGDSVAGYDPPPFAPSIARTEEIPTDSNDISFSFDDLPDSPSAAGTDDAPAVSEFSFDDIPSPSPEHPDDDTTSFAGILETIGNEVPAPDALDFSFGDREGSKKERPEELGKKEPEVSRKPVDPGEFDDLFRDDEPDNKRA